MKYKAALLMTYSSPYFRYFIAMQPEQYALKMRCPVLAIFGEKDIQISAPENAELMRKCLQKANHAHHSRVEIIAGANHLFQKCHECTISEYGQLEETIAPEVLELLFSWIKGIISLHI
jgi:fermentation-respiration switch protein FrsA (DUF1100 family)